MVEIPPGKFQISALSNPTNRMTVARKHKICVVIALVSPYHSRYSDIHGEIRVRAGADFREAKNDKPTLSLILGYTQRSLPSPFRLLVSSSMILRISSYLILVAHYPSLIPLHQSRNVFFLRNDNA
jgi:hypothetical protein